MDEVAILPVLSICHSPCHCTITILCAVFLFSWGYFGIFICIIYMWCNKGGASIAPRKFLSTPTFIYTQPIQNYENSCLHSPISWKYLQFVSLTSNIAYPSTATDPPLPSQLDSSRTPRTFSPLFLHPPPPIFTFTLGVYAKKKIYRGRGGGWWQEKVAGLGA